MLDAAVDVAREDGIAALSMRAVARRLGVPPMTLYGYVANKEALDVLVIDRILSEVRIPTADAGPWDVRLRLLLIDARRVLVQRPRLGDGHPAVGGGAIELLHRGAFGHEASRLVDAVVDLLRQGGFTDEHVDVCFGALFIYVTGYAEQRTTSDFFDIGLAALIEGLKPLAGPR
ncbi:MAG: TetR/AcrR family transcriptional regulator [Acidimicrobiales bacterium]